jgi:hypothetical protein
MPNGTETTASIFPLDAAITRIPLSQPETFTSLPGTISLRKEESARFPGDVIVFSASGTGNLAYRGSVPRLSQSDLYPVRHAFAPEHVTALRLLGLAVKRTERSLKAMDEGDEIAADSEAQKVQMLLPELFCCRSLGDGFGIVVSGLLGAFESLKGNPPSVLQLRTLNRLFSLLRDKPFLSSDEGDEQLEQLEAAQLSPYPAELVEFLSRGESVR